MFLLATVDIVWGIVNMHQYILAAKPPEADGDDDAKGREVPIKILQCKFLLYITSK